MNKKAFTLVELIVVITILAILGTIAFISMQGYSKSSRDSVRISDLSTMKTSLELFYLDSSKYPNVTDGFTVKYTGSDVWTQGAFGDDTTANIDKLDKNPTDPLTDKTYTYSITKTKQEYQLAGLVESDDYSFNNSLVNNANAGDILSRALVTGNYNGLILKTLSGTDCTILSVPSIISSLPNTTTDLETILSSTGLVYNGYYNLPNNYISSKYKSDGGFEFVSNNLISYSDNNSCNDLYDSDGNGPSARANLIDGLINAYSGTILEDSVSISQYTHVDTNNAEVVALLGSNLVNNFLGGSLDISTLVLGPISAEGYALSETFGWINIGIGIDGVNISGYSQSETLGWICFDSSCGSTVLRNIGNGDLTGYAISEIFGWIDMTGVNVSDIGEFTGYGQSEVLGWIEF